MSVHMVRAFVEKPAGELSAAVDDWAANFEPWDGDRVSHGLTERNTELNGSGIDYICGEWRFRRNGEVPSGILNSISTELDGFDGGLWHRIGYHVCDHDEDFATPCAWDEVIESGSIPSGVPTIEVSN